MPRSSSFASIFATIAAMPMLTAMDTDIRIVPQVLFSNAGFEPGVALELRADTSRQLVLRPEVLLTNHGDDIGGGFSALIGIFEGAGTALPRRSSILVGPRVIHHNDEDYGWDAGAMALWTMAVGRDIPETHHNIEVLAVLGAVKDREEDDVDPSLTVGAAYAYRF